MLIISDSDSNSNIHTDTDTDPEVKIDSVTEITSKNYFLWQRYS